MIQWQDTNTVDTEQGFDFEGFIFNGQGDEADIVAGFQDFTFDSFATGEVNRDFQTLVAGLDLFNRRWQQAKSESRHGNNLQTTDRQGRNIRCHQFELIQPLEDFRNLGIEILAFGCEVKSTLSPVEYFKSHFIFKLGNQATDRRLGQSHE